MRLIIKGAVPTVAAILLFVGAMWSEQTPVARGAPAAQATPDPTTTAAFTKAGCVGCHTIPGVPNAVGLVGPNLSKIGSEASSRKAGMSAEAYIRESILTPEAFTAPACPPSNGACPSGVMPPNFGERLSAKEIDLIVAYLLTLKGDAVTAAPTYILTPLAIVRPPETKITPFGKPPKTFENDAEVMLGKYLFFDTRLSADSSVSCASCHKPEKTWTDGKELSDGYPGTLYFRNTPTLLNTTFASYNYWDGRMDGGDMATLVRDHLTEAHFYQSDGRLLMERMKQIPEYNKLFQDAYKGSPSFGRILNAVSAYVQSLNSATSKYDRYVAGDKTALSPQAESGYKLFTGKAGCSACHSGPTLSSYKFYALGVPENQKIYNEPLRHITYRRFFRTLGLPNYRNTFEDVGLYALTLNQTDYNAFRAAPLREVAQTAPYMHNGMFATLNDVVKFYNAGGGKGNKVLKPLNLNDEEVKQLVAFLESLSSEQPKVDVPAAPNYQTRPLGDNK